MVDATDLKSVDRKVVRVQVPSPPFNFRLRRQVISAKTKKQFFCESALQSPKKIASLLNRRVQIRESVSMTDFLDRAALFKEVERSLFASQ